MHPQAAKILFDEDVGRWPPDIAAKRAWVVHRVEYPVIDVEFTGPGRTPLRLRFDAANWDDEPPKIALLNSVGDYLTSAPATPSSIFNGGPHALTGRPFVCMAGAWEYHRHESHLNTPWDQYRGKANYGLSDILTQIWNGWRKGTG